MKSFNILKKILLFFIVINSLTFLINIQDGFALNNNEEYLDIDIEFEMFEASVQEGFYNTVNSLDIALPTPTWNIKDLEMNFTNIEFNIETKIIEENSTDYVLIYKKNKAFGVQINISEPTIIYGVYLYGYESEPATTTTIRVQINGYDYIWNKPNATKYRSAVLNMSGETKWYYQNFSSPILLSKGYYYLILNGTQMLPQDPAEYYWYMNDISPIYPELYTSSYDSGTWLEGIQGAPFLYALRQKVNMSIFPENINMTAQIDGNSYTISNGSSQGKGFLKKTNVNYNPNKNKFNIEIKSNINSPLKCNLSYNLNINNILVSQGKLKVKYNETNEWILTPEIKKYSNSHTIRFVYPNNWYEIQILKDYIDITSELLVDNISNLIIFPNEVIQNNSYWEIRAKSPSIKFSIKALNVKFKPGNQLDFSIGTPILDGNYTFKLYNPSGNEIYSIKKELPKDSNVFLYNISYSATEGNYTAYVFWNNQTDAGAQVQIFQISSTQITSKDDYWVLPLIIGLAIAGGVVVLGSSSYLTIKKSQSRKREKLKMILEKCTDIMSLRHIIVLHTKSGIDVYSQSFGGEELDPTLIAGFLQAIHNFGSEVIEHAKDSRTVKVEYQKSNIIMTEFVNLRLIIIMDKNPSKNFYYSIESLAYYIYKYYGKLLEKFQGNLKPFRSIEKLVEKTLNVSFIYPLKIKVNKNLKLSQSEKEMVKKASTFMKENNFDYFYSLYLLPDNVCSPKDYGTILNLIEKGVFQPIEDNSNQ